MSLKDNYKAAVAITTALVLVSAVLGSHRSLAAERRAVEKTIETGADGSGYSIVTDLMTARNVAANLGKVAAKYLPAESGSVKELQAAVAAVDRLEPFTQAGTREAFAKLRSACAAVQTALDGVADVAEADRAYLVGFRIDLEAAAHSIALDPYNDLARQFNNEILGKFPAKLLGGLTGIRPLETFDS